MNKAREESKMEKGYGIFKERKAGWCNAAFQLQSGFLGFVLFWWYFVFFVLMNMSFVFGISRTNTYSHKNQFILESLSGQER